MTGLNWGISAGQMIALGLYTGYQNELFGNELSIKTTEVSDNVKSFVRDTLHDDKIIIKNIDDPILETMIPVMATSKKILIGKSPFIPSLESIIEQDVPEEDKKILEFTLHHEHNHIKSKDTLRFVTALCTIPFGIHSAARLVGRKVIPYITKAFTKISTKPKSISGTKWFFKELIKIPSGQAKYTTGILSFMAYHRHREQKADDNVPEDIDILKGGARYFRKHIKYEPNFHYNPFLKILSRLFSFHPSPEHRLKKLESRIKNLKQQESS